MIHRVGMIGLVVAALAAFGCSSSNKSSTSTPSTCNIGVDAGTNACTGGQTYVYVVTGLGLPIDQTKTPAEFPGFNLDCTDAATCGDPSMNVDPIPDGQWMGATGIDNGLAAGPLGGVVPTLLQQSLAPAILDGSALVLVRLEHVDSLTNDSCVTMDLLAGAVPPADAGNAMAYLDANNDQTIDSGLTLDVSPSSYDASGNPLSTAQAAIVNGKIVATPNTLALNLGAFTLQVPTAKVSFDVSANTLSNGVLGGVLTVTAFADSIAPLLSMKPSDFAASIAPYADMSSPAASCDSVSLGVTFQAVNAVIGYDPAANIDGGVPDAGTPDAGATIDAGTPADAGTAADAGTPADAGTTMDAGTPADAGADAG